MSAILELQDRIQNTIALITQYEKAIAEPGAPSSLRVSIRGLQKLLASLEREFEKYAHEEELEICRYRLIPNQSERHNLAAIGNIWSRYQSFFSAVYAAVANKNSEKRRSTKALRSESEFAFRYAFSKSIGVALTLPTGMDYFRTRDLKEASEVIRRMMQARNTDDLAAFIDTFGVPPVIKLGEWVDAHVAFNSGAGLEWDIAGDAPAPLLVQLQEFQAIKEAMSKIDEPVETERTVAGLLEGASIKRGTFEMRLDSGEELKGRFSDAISEQQKAKLPQRYSAVVRTTTTIKPAIEKKEVVHFLVRLLQQLDV